jgi:hypothetical protein
MTMGQKVEQVWDSANRAIVLDSVGARHIWVVVAGAMDRHAIRMMQTGDATQVLMVNSTMDAG